MITDENNQTLIDLDAALTEANANPIPAPDPKLVFTPLTAAQLKVVPADVAKKIADRGAVLTARATAVAKARTVINRIVADAQQKVEKLLKG